MKFTKNIKRITCVFCMLALWSCKPREAKDLKSYLSYLADPGNGLVKEKNVSGVKYKVKFLPADYLAYNTLKNMKPDAHSKDSILRSYDHSICFLLNIGPSENESFDITRLGVADYEEFAARIEKMSFEAQQWISIKVKDTEYKPEIVRMENINALEKNRNFIIVFSTEKGTEKDLRNGDMCLSYTDELFHTGTNKFIFKAQDLKELPAFKF